MAAFTEVLLLCCFYAANDYYHILSKKTAKGGLAMSVAKKNAGNLTIPYPFGIGKPGCYLDEPFRVNCNSSTQVATLPYFLNVTIYNISSDSIIINAYGSSVVYNSSSGKNMEKGDVETVGYELLQPHFSISHTNNKFVALGCDIFSFLKDFRTGSIITGCASFCVNKDRNRLRQKRKREYVATMLTVLTQLVKDICVAALQGYQGNPYLPSGCQGVGVGISILIFVVAGFWLNRKLKKMKLEKTKERFFKRNGGFLLQKQMPTSNRGSVLEMKIFKTEELEKATDNFNQSRILGKGGLGTVYKGMLSDGRIVAVKKSNKVNESQVGQFINEISILSQINHRNIVKVLGCCLETEVPLVVYEYISNGTLSQHLNNNNTNSSASPLSWTHRLRIGAEIAGALAYLHSCASTAIFHRDIKSSNILLGENYRAVISDFGLSRSVHIDRTHLTTVVGGTFGYLDPEYFRSGHLNDKSDVYAFGVVLAELLTGQKVISSNTSDEGLAIRFKTSLKQKDGLFEILDRAVANEGGEEEIFVVAKLAKRCIKLNARKRPGMMEVATELQRLARTNGEDLQRRPNGFEDSYFSSSAMSFDYSSGPISFDYNLDLSTDKTM
nr:wall-associated receptor kinase 5-like [Ipomoea batatas]